MCVSQAPGGALSFGLRVLALGGCTWRMILSMTDVTERYFSAKPLGISR
jgi:hypothetical protein